LKNISKIVKFKLIEMRTQEDEYNEKKKNLNMSIHYCERTLGLTKDAPMLKYYIDERDKVIDFLNNIR